MTGSVSTLPQDQIEKIQFKLGELVRDYVDFDFLESQEDRSFTDRIFEAFGLNRRRVGCVFQYHAKKESEDGRVTTLRSDALWQPHMILEYKSPGNEGQSPEWDIVFEKVRSEYWVKQGRPRYIILSNFREFLFYDTHTPDFDLIRQFQLKDLPENWDAFVFMIDPARSIRRHREEISTTTSEKVDRLITKLLARSIDPVTITQFIPQIVFCFFGEALEILPPGSFSNCLFDGNREKARFADILYSYFCQLNDKNSKILPYVNGDIFSQPTFLPLQNDEIEILVELVDFKWEQVSPVIFGNILESLRHTESIQTAGMVYTHEEDIDKIVKPLVTDLWEERLRDFRRKCDLFKSGKKVSQKSLVTELTEALTDLTEFVICDPACGAGNFLFVAYKELKRIEAEIQALLSEVNGAPSLFLSVSPENCIVGVDVNEFALAIARVVIWIAHEQAIKEHRILDFQPKLPLRKSDFLIFGDALIRKVGNGYQEWDWPEANVYLGNPPFVGSRKMNTVLRKHGEGYVKSVREIFSDRASGNVDYGCYWFIKAIQKVDAGARAGFVITNGIRYGDNRKHALFEILKRGQTIFFAIANQQWPDRGVAVRVSIVCWTKGAQEKVVLENKVVPKIQSNLTAEPYDLFHSFECFNKGESVQGVILGGPFEVTAQQAMELGKTSNTSGVDNSSVLKRFYRGEDILQKHIAPIRYIISFAGMTFKAAADFEAPIALLRSNISNELRKAFRDELAKNGKGIYSLGDALPVELADAENGVVEGFFARNGNWHKQTRDRKSFYRKAEKRGRHYIVTHRSSKHRLFEFIRSTARVESNIIMFAYGDFYHWGILSSTIHGRWVVANGNKLGAGDTDRYEQGVCFESFPFPEVDQALKKEIGYKAACLYRWTRRWCRKNQASLTDLYNKNIEKLNVLQRELDESVCSAYGFSYGEDYVKKIFDLNQKLGKKLAKAGLGEVAG